MELMLRNGDYVPDGLGGFRRQEGREETLSKALFLLTVRRGSFPFLPELGSQLWKLSREKPSARRSAAIGYAQEALEPLDVAVRDAEVTEEAGGTARVAVVLEWNGETETVEVTV